MNLTKTLFGGLWKQSILRSADNTGIIKAMIVGMGHERYGTGSIGMRVRMSPRDKTPECAITKLPKGVIVRRRKETRRADGSYLRFSDNAFVVIHKNKAKGTKIKGPVPLEVRHNVRQMARYIF